MLVGLVAGVARVMQNEFYVLYGCDSTSLYMHRRERPISSQGGLGGVNI